MAKGRNVLDQLGNLVRKDTYAVIWLVFIAAIIILTYFGKHYIKDMIVTSIMFLAIVLLEPLVHQAHSNKLTRLISGGKHVPAWKRFPIFFVAILIVFAIKHFLEAGLDRAFGTSAINPVFVFFWLSFLFLIYFLLFSKMKH